LCKAKLLKNEPRPAKPVRLPKTTIPPVNNQESRELENLKRLNREVRTHEHVHVIAGNSLARGAGSTEPIPLLLTAPRLFQEKTGNIYPSS
jgi:hypothetical protein